MKNLNFLSNLCGLRRASQSSDVGYDCRSTVVRPSFDCRSTLLKLVSVLALIFTLGVGNVWGDPTTIYSETFGTVPSGDNNKAWADYLALATRYYTDNNTPTVIGISGTWKVGNGNANDGSNFWANASGAYCTFTFGKQKLSLIYL